MLQPNKKFLEVASGETLAYLDHGQGQKIILLIHGNMSSSYHYLPLIERLSPAQFRIIAVDLRGFGDSSYRNRFDSLRSLSDDVASLVRLLKLDKMTVVGWSAGGGIALQLAAFYPDLVEKLFLIDSMSYKGIPIFKKDASMRPLIGEVYPSKEAMALDPLQVAPAVQALASGNVAFMDYIWNLVIYTVNKPTPEANKVYLAETMKQRNLVDFDWSLVTFNMSTESNFQIIGDGAVAQIQCPVYSVYGRDDKTVLEYMVKETVAALKGPATLKIYEKCGHSPLVDVPDELTRDLVNFILG